MSKDAGKVGEAAKKQDPPGIVIRDHEDRPYRPVIAAFIWGARVEPVPTLPFGRWKPKTA